VGSRSIHKRESRAYVKLKWAIGGLRHVGSLRGVRLREDKKKRLAKVVADSLIRDLRRFFMIAGRGKKIRAELSSSKEEKRSGSD